MCRELAALPYVIVYTVGRSCKVWVRMPMPYWDGGDEDAYPPDLWGMYHLENLMEEGFQRAMEVCCCLQSWWAYLRPKAPAVVASCRHSLWWAWRLRTTLHCLTPTPWVFFGTSWAIGYQLAQR